MLTAAALIFVLPALVSNSDKDNIHLLEDEVASALRACSYNETTAPKRDDYQNQQGSNFHKIGDRPKLYTGSNVYDHESRKSSEQTYIYNGTGNTSPNCRTGRKVQYTQGARISYNRNRYDNRTWQRIKRTNSLIIKSNQDKCLSQCVFANLQVVDARGIPRQAELSNKVQTAVTSHQSRILLQDQIRACFQELQSESEDDGCAYSNSLERCLMLRFSDRKLNGNIN